MTSKARLLLFMLTMYLLLSSMVLILNHLIIRSVFWAALTMDVVLMAFMSLPFIGFWLNAGKPPSRKKRILLFASPLVLGFMTLAGLFLGHPCIGGALGIGGILVATVYYYLDPRKD